MKEVNLQGAQVSPVQLDVKQHSNKTLSELQILLQTGSTLKGSVISVSKGGDVIFTTAQGKFSAQIPTLSQGLNKGDKLTFKIEINNEQLIGHIVTVNGTSAKGTKPIALNFIKPDIISDSFKGQTSSENIDIHSLKLPSTPVKAVISYLNLSQINKNSILSKALTPAHNGSHLEFKIVTDNVSTVKSPYNIIGEVLASEGDKQIIKTPFGILTAKHTEAFPIGKKIHLEIKTVDNKPVDHITIPSKVEDFIFKLNNNSSLLKSLLNITSFKDSQAKPLIPATQNSSPNIVGNFRNSSMIPFALKAQIVNSLLNDDNKSVVSNLLQNKEQLTMLTNNLEAKTLTDLIAKLNLMPAEKISGLFKAGESNTQKTIQNKELINNQITPSLQGEEAHQQLLKTSAIIEKALKSPQQKEAILQLSEDFSKLKELLNIVIKQDENNKWHNFFLPIYDGERVTQNKVSIRKKPNQYTRFIVELSLEALGELQLDGLIKLKPDTNIPENFDLSVRFKDKLNLEVQTQISEIYMLSQNISGVKGGLSFERVDGFTSEPTDSN